MVLWRWHYCLKRKDSSMESITCLFMRKKWQQVLWKRNYRCSSLNGLTKLLALEEGDHFVPWEEWAIPSGWGIRHISCTADQVSRLHHGKHLPKPASKISSLSSMAPNPHAKPWPPVFFLRELLDPPYNACHISYDPSLEVIVTLIQDAQVLPQP